MIYLDEQLTVADAVEIARERDWKLVQDFDGNIRLAPRGPRRRRVAESTNHQQTEKKPSDQ